ncbi:YkgJ family cysteine cluster protein [Clostridium lundense]|uniref:YkgJ family cysteine cluster protein n=1 Tax=Clostridium lundense TaxID=319475 RepID=UPI000482EC0E|nr:YkgJ family cysteine cluster protein [Clostridium lundense]
MGKEKLKSLGKNYLGVDMVYNETKTDKIYDEISNILLKEIAVGDLSVSKGKELLKKIYDLYDTGNKEFEQYASCKKGCSHCCCLYVDCTAIEAELIREYVENNFTEEEKTTIKNKIDDLLTSLPTSSEVDENLKHALNYLKEKIPCPFLSENGSCTIYPVRTFNCRKFLTITPAEECANGAHVVKINPSINNIGMYSISMLSMNVTRYKKLMVPNGDEYKALYKGISAWLKNGFKEIDRTKE